MKHEKWDRKILAIRWTAGQRWYRWIGTMVKIVVSILGWNVEGAWGGLVQTTWTLYYGGLSIN